MPEAKPHADIPRWPREQLTRGCCSMRGPCQPEGNSLGENRGYMHIARRWNYLIKGRLHQPSSQSPCAGSSAQRQWVSKGFMHHRHLEGLWRQISGSHPESLTQQIWGVVRYFAFLTSSQRRLLTLAGGPHVGLLHQEAGNSRTSQRPVRTRAPGILRTGRWHNTITAESQRSMLGS